MFSTKCALITVGEDFNQFKKTKRKQKIIYKARQGISEEPLDPRAMNFPLQYQPKKIGSSVFRKRKLLSD